LDDANVKQLIAASVPDTTFNRIKVHQHMKDVWDELKGMHEAETALVIMDLQGQLARTRMYLPTLGGSG
jgi:gag-polypeptide of LTR copia-type